MAKKLNNIDFQTSIGCRLGSLFLQSGKLKEAKIVLVDAFQQAEQIGGFPNLQCLTEKLSMVYEANGKYDLALLYYKKSESYQDSILNLEKNVRLVELEKQYRTEQQSKQIIEKDLKISQQQNQQRNLIIGGLSILLLLFGGFQYIRYRFRLDQQKADSALELEQMRGKQLKELDQLKSNFFANISHEFRTPLTLILNPLKKIEEQLHTEGSNETLKKSLISSNYVSIMSKNGERLLKLINQLLDLSKIENGKLKLKISQGDVTKLLKNIVFSFESLAQRKEIILETEFPENDLSFYFDKDKIEKIVSNLLSNAFKFTDDGGTISFFSRVENETLQIIISDSGKGIPESEVHKIFNRFYQVQGNEDRGTGIGLSLVKELVELHKGQISVESKIREGTSFKINLPVGESFFEKEEFYELGDINEDKFTAHQESQFVNTITNTTVSNKNQSSNLPLILIVEDNQDLRDFMNEILHKKFNTLLAENGKEGLEKAIENIPDLILSDVMMPVMDGNKMTYQLKNDERTSHIPIILLTAKAGRENRIEGLEKGVDDYLIKPFDEKELLVRIQNLIEQRKTLRTRFSKEIKLQPKDIAITSLDEIFLNKVLDGIEKNLSNSNFSVEDLGKFVGMSRSQLHRKLTALSDQTPNYLIRKMRLERSKKLLESKAGSISEIAYKVGFSSPAYFSKCFQDQFGVSPSEYK